MSPSLKVTIYYAWVTFSSHVPRDFEFFLSFNTDNDIAADEEKNKCAL
jgi:hypothetical protein